MTTITIYRNKRNENKYIEVHNDGYYHNSVKQYMQWKKDHNGRKITMEISLPNRLEMKRVIESYIDGKKQT